MYSSHLDGSFNLNSDTTSEPHFSKANRVYTSRVFGDVKVDDYKTVLDEQGQAQKPTHGEPSSGDAHALKGVASEAFPEPDDGRLAKQPRQYKRNQAFDGELREWRVDNFPHKCGDYVFSKRRSGNENQPFFPCNRMSCANPFCRKKWSELWHNMLHESFKVKPPTHFITITFKQFPAYKILSNYLKDVRKSNRKLDKNYQYYYQIESGERSGNVHVHILTITKLTSDELCQSIKQVLSEIKTSVEIQDCDNEIDALAISPKTCLDIAVSFRPITRSKVGDYKITQTTFLPIPKRN